MKVSEVLDKIETYQKKTATILAKPVPAPKKEEKKEEEEEEVKAEENSEKSDEKMSEEPDKSKPVEGTAPANGTDVEMKDESQPKPK